MVLVGLPLLAAGAVVLGIAPNFAVALIGGGLLGLGNGAVDIAMNAYGVLVEQARDRPVMSRLHALWSLGNFSGAGLILLGGLVLGRAGPATILPLVLGTAAAATVIVTLALRRAPELTPNAVTEQGADRGPIPPVAWLLGLMAVAFGLAEGTAYDWSSLHITDVARVDPTWGALGLAVTAGFMVLIRLVGDGLVLRVGRRLVVSLGGATAAVGYALVGLAEPLPLLLAGWAAVGLGVGMVAPQVYAIAGHLGGGRVLSVVVTFGYATFLAGPAVMGALIGVLGIQQAMLVPGLMCVALALLARGMPAH